MFTPDAFTESQGNFVETQQRLTGMWEGYLRQLLESQQKLTNSWTQSLPSGATPANFSESMEKTMSFQQELINTTLDNQLSAVSLAVETQKQLWNSYFQMTQKTMQNMTMPS